MTDIGPGTELEFIGPDFHDGYASGLMVGAIYVCAKVVEAESECDICRTVMPDIMLTVLTPFEFYCPCLFKPLRDGQERIERKAVKRVCEPA